MNIRTILPDPHRNILARFRTHTGLARNPEPLDIVALSPAFSRPPPHHAMNASFQKIIISSPPAHHATLLWLCPFPLAATSRTSFAANDWSRCSQPPSPTPASHLVSASFPRRRSQPPASPQPTPSRIAHEQQPPTSSQQRAEPRSLPTFGLLHPPPSLSDAARGIRSVSFCWTLLYFLISHLIFVIIFISLSLEFYCPIFLFFLLFSPLNFYRWICFTILLSSISLLTVVFSLTLLQVESALQGETVLGVLGVSYACLFLPFMLFVLFI